MGRGVIAVLVLLCSLAGGCNARRESYYQMKALVAALEETAKHSNDSSETENVPNDMKAIQEFYRTTWLPEIWGYTDKEFQSRTKGWTALAETAAKKAKRGERPTELQSLHEQVAEWKKEKVAKT